MSGDNPLASKNSEGRLAYYERVFEEHKSAGWDVAPGKEVILNAVARTRLLFPETGTMCDVGCGGGLLLHRVKCEILPDWKFLGVDFSSNAIKAATQAYPEMEFRVEDGAAIALDDASIDILISYGSYEHFPDPALGINELARILRPSGYFFLMIPTLEGYWSDTAAVAGWYPDKTGQPQWNYSRRTWESFFVGSGLDLWPGVSAERYGARNPDVFFLGTKARG